MNLRAHRWVGGALALAITAFTAQDIVAQTTMPSSLRHGSGYMDTPVASVLPHLAIQGTFSGFYSTLDNTVIVDPTTGDAIGRDPAGAENYFYPDASFAIGLFDRAEIGASILSLNDQAEGGNLFGLFGRLAILKPEAQGLGLAVGARYNNAPDYGDANEYMPNRLGYPDSRFRGDYPGKDVDTELTLYGVGSLFLRGFSASWFPENDVSIAVGYGNGMFTSGDDLPFYSYVDGNGWFAGSGMAIELGERTLLHVVGEWNGFDLNMGTQLDYNGLRVGAYLLGTNHTQDISRFRSTKLGLLGSVAFCGSGLCTPSLMDRPEPEVVQLPAPAPDTVIVTREVEPAMPTGNPQNICLATGQDVRVLMTAQGDTLVGENRVSIRTLRPGVVFAGTYADGRDWFTNDEDVMYDERSFSKSGNPVSQMCANIMRVGEYMGVPLFAARSAERPFTTLYVPVRPGVWQAYEDLGGIRGQ